MILYNLRSSYIYVLTSAIKIALNMVILDFASDSVSVESFLTIL